MKILSINQFNEKLQASKINLSDLSSLSSISINDIEEAERKNISFPLELGQVASNINDFSKCCLRFLANNELYGNSFSPAGFFKDRFPDWSFETYQYVPCVFPEWKVNKQTNRVTQYIVHMAIDGLCLDQYFPNIDFRDKYHEVPRFKHKQWVDLSALGIHVKCDTNGVADLDNFESFANHFKQVLPDNIMLHMLKPGDDCYSFLKGQQILSFIFDVSENDVIVETGTNLNIGFSIRALNNIKKQFGNYLTEFNFIIQEVIDKIMS